jgi:hypothetical protein
MDINSLTKTKAWETTPLLDTRYPNYSAAGAGHSALTQQESALGHSALQHESGFWQQESAFWQHFSTHSVFGQHSLAHSPWSAFLQQQATRATATTAVNKIFFIRLKS